MRLRRVVIGGLLAMLAGFSLLALTLSEIGRCSDECHGFVFPLGLCALLVLAGLVAVVGAGVKWKIDRFLGT
jgi:hypothetical protein